MRGKHKTGHTSLPDLEERELIVSALDRNVLIEASAGTGKTTSIVARMLAALRTGACINIGQIAAVTFTRKAAAELRSRFHMELEKALKDATGEESERLGQALEHVEEAFIGTIHSFCGRLLRERPVEAGVDLTFEEIEDDADRELREEAWNLFAGRITEDDEENLLARLHELGLNLADIRPSFFDFADFPDVDEWPVPYVSIGDLNLDETRGELEEYVNSLGQIVPLLPRDAGNDNLIPRLERLPRIVAHYDLDKPEELMQALALFEAEAKVIQRVWKEAGLSGSDAVRERERWNSFREDVALPALRSWREMRYRVVMRLLHKARDTYDGLRRQAGVLNFQDLLMKAAGLLRENREVRRYFRSRFTHVFVDEFQDTDPVQAEVIILLASSSDEESMWRKAKLRPGSLFVVGDPKQSIYRFRRADISTYDEVKRIIERDGGLVIRLSANFRADAEILAWVNSVFAPAAAAEPEALPRRFPEEECAESPSYVPLLSGRPDEEGRDPCGILRLDIPETYTRQEEVIPYEAEMIARGIRAMLDADILALDGGRGGSGHGQWRPSDFMIMTRNTARLGAYARALHDYGIPCRVAGGSGLSQIAELKLLTLCLRCISRPDDPVALVAVLRSELFGISDDLLYSFKKAGGTFSFHAAVPEGLRHDEREIIEDAFSRLRSYYLLASKLPAVPAIESIASDLGLIARACVASGGDLATGGIYKALELLRQAQPGMWSGAEVVDFLEGLTQPHDRHDAISIFSGEDCVRIMNIHKAKGLEARIVFLADPYGSTNHDIVRHVDRSEDKVLGYLGIFGAGNVFGRRGGLLAHASDWEALAERERAFLDAEELRLRYVAATRSGNTTIISQKAKRNSDNPWSAFDPYVRSCWQPPEQWERATAGDAAKLSLSEIEFAREDINRRLQQSARPSYRAYGAKEFALSQVAEYDAGDQASPGYPDSRPLPSLQPMQQSLLFEESPAEDEAERYPEVPGAQRQSFGEAIHSILEAAIRDADYALEAEAAAQLQAKGLSQEYASYAVDVVKRTMASELWKRASSSPRRLAEIPFHMMLESADAPTLIRGVIDLVFEESDGWVLVDYKTDRAEGKVLDSLVKLYTPQIDIYRMAWEKCSEQAVKEVVFYFTHTGKAITGS